MINLSDNRQIFSLSIIRLVGYGLLVMAVIDFISLLLPPQLMNPTWEFQTMGAIVERIPVTLLGMVLVYFGAMSDRTPIEIFILKWLSHLSLIIGILLFLMIPLSLTNTFRIYYQNTAKVNLQLSQQVETIQDFKGKLNAASSLDQLRAILQNQASQAIAIPDSVDTDKLKENIITNLNDTETNLRSQAKNLTKEQSSIIFKNSIKWNLGAFISSILFLIIWKSTFWARIPSTSEE
jgi:hypothetical protein